MADDYTTSLSADTLQILQQFYMEKQKQEEEEEKLLKNNDLDKKQAENFSEDWQLSQFWVSHNHHHYNIDKKKNFFKNKLFF